MADCTNFAVESQPRTGVIYFLQNTINGKGYVGKTIQKLSARLSQHKCYKNQLVNRAIQKYGWENFTHEVLEENIPREMLDEREIFWIAKLKTKAPNGYNLTDGGEGGSGRIVTKEQRARLSEINKGNKNRLGKHHSEETKAKISAANKGIRHSEEHKAKLSASAKGRPSPMKGKHHSAETRAKISALNKGKTLSKETREKIGAAQKGKVVSEETRAKMSASHKAKNKKLEEEKSDD